MDKSYKNVYGTEKHNKFMEGQYYVIDDKFLVETEYLELSDGFPLKLGFMRKQSKYWLAYRKVL